MFRLEDLFRERFSLTVKEWLRYLQYILNGHLMVVLIFLIGYVAFSYSAWLQMIPPEFPIIPIVTVILGFTVTYSSIFTYLLNADRVFLLPLESKMGTYFRKSLVTSLIGHIFILFIVLGICMPILKVASENYSFFLLLFLFTLLKLFNLVLRWFIQKDTNKRNHRIDQLGRFILNIVSIYFIFTSPLIIICLFVLLYIGVILFYYYSYKDASLKWDFIIDQEENRIMKFYRFANLFTEVHQLKNEVKRRKYLDFILQRISFSQQNVYVHLYSRALLRSGDYFGLVVRLSVIGLLFIYLIESTIGIIACSVLFLFLTAFQLIGLYRIFDYHLMVAIYPLNKEQQKQGFFKVFQYTLFIQCIFLSIGVAILHSVIIGAFCLVACVLFIVLYSQLYVKRILK